MGLIGKILGIGASVDKFGGAVERVAEVFVPNRTKSDAFTYSKGQASLDQFAAEFKFSPASPFESFVNGLNRMPRPTLTFGTVGLFAYAMSDPVGFSIRMQRLDTVPDQLWWLLGAIIPFYFRHANCTINGKRITRRMFRLCRQSFLRLMIAQTMRLFQSGSSCKNRA